MFGITPVLWIAKFLIGRKPGMTQANAERIAKIILVGIAIVVLGLFLWWLRADAVSDYKVRDALDRAEDTIEATNRADENAEPREQARITESEETREELETIHAEDPEAAAAPAAPGSRTVAGRLRND